MEHDADPTQLATLFARVSEELSASTDVPVTFDLVSQRAVEVVAADHCGLTIRGKRGETRSAASSSDIARRADELQHELVEGPCVGAAFDRQDVVVSDLIDDRRYPRWAREATDLGLRSVFAVALRGENGVLGAINFYAEKPMAFDDPSERALAAVYASHAAEALRQAQLVSGLRAALESRHAIGMAQGVLAATYGLDYDRAFSVLHRYSNDTNTKLRDVAQLVLDLRALPPLEG